MWLLEISFNKCKLMVTGNRDKRSKEKVIRVENAPKLGERIMN